MRANTLPVSEVFGPTFQGEGRYQGQLCGFLRLGLCNLSCEWCDTPFTWDHTRYDVAAECPPRTPGHIALNVRDLNVPIMVLSGGEPTIHALRDPDCALGQLFDLTHDLTDWHVETNGTTQPPGWFTAQVAHVTVSPKIGTRDPESKRLKPAALNYWAHAARMGLADFKFVAIPGVLEVVDQLVPRYGIPPERVWIMPEGVHPADVLDHHRDLADQILARRYNTTTRLHTLLWGNERGH
jgi:organic radical activating enzyme